MNVLQFDEFVLVPALESIGMYSSASHVLMLGTGIIESNFEFIKQASNGPAMGFYQIEETTYNDILRYLNRPQDSRLKENCLSSCFYVAWPPSSALIHNIKWSVIVARLKYYMQSEPLPAANDVKGMSSYYKRYYNTAKGAANPNHIESVFDSVIKAMNK